MYHTWKGIYLKFRKDGANITNVLYENIWLEVSNTDRGNAV